MKFDDVVKYKAIIQEVIALAKKAEKAKPGEIVDVPAVRTRVGKQLWEIEAHRMTRLD